MFFCASSTSSAPRWFCNSVSRLRCERNASSRPAISASCVFFRPMVSAVCALTCSRSCCKRSIWRLGILNLGLRLLLAGDEDGTLVAPRLDQLRQFADALFQRAALLAEGRRPVARPTPARPCFRSAPRSPRRAAGGGFPVRRSPPPPVPARRVRALPIHSSARPGPRASPSLRVPGRPGSPPRTSPSRSSGSAGARNFAAP